MTFLKPNNQSAKDGVRTVLSAIFDRQRSIAAPSSLHSVDYQLVMSCCSAIRWVRLLNLTRHSSRLISFSAYWDIVNITGSFTNVLLVNPAVDRHSVYMYIVRKIGGPKSYRSFPRISVPLWVCKNISYFWNHCLIHRVVISRKAILGEPRGENVVSYIWSYPSIVFSEISWLAAETIIAKLDDAGTGKTNLPGPVKHCSAQYCSQRYPVNRFVSVQKLYLVQNMSRFNWDKKLGWNVT